MENPCRVTDEENRNKMINELVKRTDNLDRRCGYYTEGEFVIRTPQISVKREDIFKISISKKEYDNLNEQDKKLVDTYPLTIRKSKIENNVGGIDLSYLLGN